MPRRRAPRDTLGDAGRLASLIKRLATADEYERARIVASIRPRRRSGQLWRSLRHWQIGRAPLSYQRQRVVLADLGSVAGPPLVATLDAKDPHLVAQAVDVLGRIEEASVADDLLAPALAADSPAEVRAIGQEVLPTYFNRVPTREQALVRLSERVRTSLASVRQSAAGIGTAEPTVVWRWDEKKKVPSPKELRPR